MRYTSFGFFTYPQNLQATKVLRESVDAALQMGYSCCVDSALYNSFPWNERVKGGIKENTPDAIIAFGGDGTILRAIKCALELNAPILGVNAGRIGFLSEIEPEGFTQALKRLSEGDFSIDRRMMLECSVNDSEPLSCLNDVLLYKHSFSGVAEIEMKIDNMAVGSVFCDGVIVSTPTGSTGYSISAGGPIVAPELDVAILTPICPHTLTARPIIAPPDAVMELSMKTSGYLALDGENIGDVAENDVIRVVKSNEHVSFVRFDRQNVYELVKRKLT